MSYLVLARKWRPQRFSEVVGQEIIIKTLSRALSSGRIAHAFLFTGSRGVGKTTLARLLAKAFTCEKSISPEPCGTCTHCESIGSGQSADIIEIDGASNTGVDDVRALREQIRYLPVSARFKIFIIDEVHMLSTNAFNALLKTLEEPPEHVKFIFATTEAHKIPVTILSRCQRYDFKRIKVSVIIDRLKVVLAEENIQVDPEALLLIAQNADGGMRDALSLLDQVISFSGNNASLQDVIDILGLIDRRIVSRITQAILEGNSKQVLEFIEEVSNLGYDTKQLLDEIGLEIRNLCLSAATGSIAGLADLTEERVQAINELAAQHELLDLQRLLDISLKASNQLSASEHPRFVLELALLKMVERPKLHQISEIQKAIQKLESMGQGTSATIITKTEPVSKNTWKHFVSAMASSMPMISHHLEHGRYNGKGKVEFDQKLHFSRIQAAAQSKDFQEHCKQHLGLVPEVTLSESIHVAQQTVIKQEQQSIEEKARNNPAVKQALSVLGGEIKAVRKA